MSPVMQLIARTGQMGKLLIGLGLLITGMMVLFLGIFFLESLTLSKLIPLSIVASALGISGFVYLCVAVSCRECGAKWIWLMATRRPGDPRYVDSGSDHCPACGSTG